MIRYLHFDKAEHQYSILHEREILIPSVTQLLKWGNIIDYSFMNPVHAEIGTEIHTMTELIDEGIYPDIAEGKVHASMMAYEKFLVEQDVVWEESETMIFSEARFYAGTRDRLGTINGTRMVVDIKSGSKVRWHALQLVGYDESQEHELASLYINGFDYNLHVWSEKDIKEARKVFSSLLDVYWYTRVMDHRRLEKIRDEIHAND